MTNSHDFETINWARGGEGNFFLGWLSHTVKSTCFFDSLPELKWRISAWNSGTPKNLDWRNQISRPTKNNPWGVEEEVEFFERKAVSLKVRRNTETVILGFSCFPCGILERQQVLPRYYFDYFAQFLNLLTEKSLSDFPNSPQNSNSEDLFQVMSE